MSPDGLGLEVLAVVAAVVSAVTLGLLWNAARGLRLILLRTATVAACLATTAAVGVVWVNRQVDFLPSWSALTGAPVSTAPQEATGGAGGRILTFSVAGRASRLTMPMYAYVPPGYHPRGPLRYPVIEAFHGYPGSPAQWLHSMTAVQILDREISAGRMAPTIVLFPFQTPDPLLDTECTNLVGGPQTETFLTRDVPAFARAHLDVRSDQSGWGLIGYSAGGYCAADLLLRHPAQYAAGAALSGYVSPGIRVGDGSEQTTYNAVWRLTHLPVPTAALYLTCAKADRGAFRATQAIAKAARAPLSLTTFYINGGGHSVQTWKAMEAPAFDWLSSWLGRPIAPPARPAATPARLPAAAAPAARMNPGRRR
jgi:enterochelin esterase-like enzyme